MSTIPTTPTDDMFPVWTDLVNNWRATDAHWLRNHVILTFPDAATRNATMTGKTEFGMISAIQAGSVAGAVDFWNGSAWESIRYPNLNVVSDGTSVTLRRQGAGTGIQLKDDGSVNMAKSFTGTGGVGTTMDNTGVSIAIGTKAVKFSTDATQLLVDSPVRIAGVLTTTGAINAPSATLGAVTVTGATSLAAVSAASVTATGAVSGATVTGGDAVLGTNGVYGSLKHRTGGTAEVDVGSDSTVRVRGSSVTVDPNTTIGGTLTVNGQTNFVGRPWFAMTGTAQTWVAGVYALQGSSAFPSDCPDGTIGIVF